MARTLFALAVLLVTIHSARAADVPLGKTTQVELEKVGGPGTGKCRTSFTIPITQGDKFRFEVSPVGGADMHLYLYVYTADGKTIESTSGGKIDWQMTKGAPGKSVKVYISSEVTGAVNVRVRKVGDAVPESGDEVKKLRAENAELRKQLAEQKKQLDEVIELLKKKM